MKIINFAIKRKKSFFVFVDEALDSSSYSTPSCFLPLHINLHFYTIPLSICLITVRCMAVATTINDTITNVKQTNKQTANDKPCRSFLVFGGKQHKQKNETNHIFFFYLFHLLILPIIYLSYACCYCH